MHKRMVTVSISIVIIVALLGVGIWWLFNTGRLVYVANPSTTSTAVVCDSSIVDKYNTAMYYEERNGSTQPTIDEAGVRNLVSEIKGKKGYDTDATCQSILFWVAIYNKDASAARTAYDAVKSLHDKRIFADSNLRSNEALFTYEGYVSGLASAGSQ